MGPGGENTGIYPRPTPGQSIWEMYQGLLIGLQSLAPLVLPFHAEAPALSPHVGLRHWGLCGLVLWSKAL